MSSSLLPVKDESNALCESSETSIDSCVTEWSSDSDGSERASALAGGEEHRFDAKPRMTSEQAAAAESRMMDRTSEMLHHRGLLLPAKLVRQLRIMIVQRHPFLIHVAFAFGIRDGTFTSVDEIDSLPPPPSGAPPRKVRPKKNLDADDMAMLKHEEMRQMWLVVAAQLAPDLDRIFEVLKMNSITLGKYIDAYMHMVILT
jgi:hypothetical protein